MVNYTGFMSDKDFDENADEVYIDWDAPPGNDTDLPEGTAPPYSPEMNATETDAMDNVMDVYDTDGFGLHFVGHAFGEENKVTRFS